MKALIIVGEKLYKVEANYLSMRLHQVGIFDYSFEFDVDMDYQKYIHDYNIDIFRNFFINNIAKGPVILYINHEAHNIGTFDSYNKIITLNEEIDDDILNFLSSEYNIRNLSNFIKSLNESLHKHNIWNYYLKHLIKIIKKEIIDDMWYVHSLKHLASNGYTKQKIIDEINSIERDIMIDPLDKEVASIEKFYTNK